MGLVPDQPDATIPAGGVSWNDTTVLDIVFLPLAAALVVRLLRTGGLGMLRMMGGGPPVEAPAAEDPPGGGPGGRHGHG